MAAVNAQYVVTVKGSVISSPSIATNPPGLILTQNSLIPFDVNSGLVQQFESADEVATYFGADSDEYLYAQTYYNSYTNALYTPNIIYFGRYVLTAIAPYIMGAGNTNYNSLLTALKAITLGTLTVTFNGNSYTAMGINLSGATSLTDAASIIQTALLAIGETTTDYTNSGVVANAVDNSGGSGSVIIYFTSSNAAASTLAALAAADSVSGTVDDTTATVNTNFVSIEAGNFTYSSNNYAYKMVVSVTSGTYTDIVATDLLTFDLAAISGSLPNTTTCSVIQVVGVNQTNYAFSISNGITGSDNTIGYASGTVATVLNMTQSLGAILSQGSDALTPANNMDNITAITTNFNGFCNIFDFADSMSGWTNEIALVSWANSNSTSQQLYLYIWWSNDSSLTSMNLSPTSGIPYQLQQAGFATQSFFADYNGADINWQYSAPVMLIYSPNGIPQLAFFTLGVMASTNYNVSNGRVQLANRQAAGLSDIVTNSNTYLGIMNNGANCYYQFSASNTAFNMFMTGYCGTAYRFIDNIYNFNWLADDIIVEVVSFLQNTPLVSNNQAGYTQLNAILNGVAADGLANGVIQTGNTFDSATTQQVINTFGKDITSNLTTNGYYIQIIPASSAQRSTRTLSPINFGYTNGNTFFCITVNTIFVE